MEKIKLKHCPFCGGEASYIFDPDGIEDVEGRKWAYQVTCNSCCATTGLSWSQRMVKEAWNRRAGDTALRNDL